MRAIVCACIVLVLCGCRPLKHISNSFVPIQCPRELWYIALNDLNPKLSVGAFDDCRSIDFGTKRQCLLRVRRWSKAQTVCVRRAYDEWIDFYDMKLTQAATECAQKGRTFITDSQREYDEWQHRAANYRDTHSVPVAPCDEGSP